MKWESWKVFNVVFESATLGLFRKAAGLRGEGIKHKAKLQVLRVLGFAVFHLEGKETCN